MTTSVLHNFSYPSHMLPQNIGYLKRPREDEGPNGTYDYPSQPNDVYPGFYSLRPTERLCQAQNEAEWKEKSRERNRQHARNTRERKKLLIENYEKRIEGLMAERARLNDEVAAKIGSERLLAMCSKGECDKSTPPEAPQLVIDESCLKASFAAIQEQEAELVDNMEDINSLKGDSSHRAELINLRKERNRIHAKKTRLRKKKLMKELEVMASTLEAEVSSLREKLHDKQGDKPSEPPSMMAQPRLSGSFDSMTSSEKTIQSPTLAPAHPPLRVPHEYAANGGAHHGMNDMRSGPRGGPAPVSNPDFHGHMSMPNSFMMNPYMQNPSGYNPAMMNPHIGNPQMSGYPMQFQPHMAMLPHSGPVHFPDMMYHMYPRPDGSGSPNGSNIPPSGPHSHNPFMAMFNRNQPSQPAYQQYNHSG